MVGKGLPWTTLAQLLFYASATFIPLALPLAILLSSIMTYGNLGEHYELVAIKSAGISLFKAMKPLIIIAILISIATFLFSNYVLPIANLKFGSLLYDIRQQKPAINIKPGVFYKEIDNYVIKIAEKNKDGKTLKDIIIYDHTKNQPAIITAEKGFVQTTPDKLFLVFKLYNGYNLSKYHKNITNEKIISLSNALNSKNKYLKLIFPILYLPELLKNFLNKTTRC
jgi:lipopolysaccharide export system permease protein